MRRGRGIPGRRLVSPLLAPGHFAEEVVAMSATKTLLPTADDLDAVEKAMGIAFNAVEELERQLLEVVAPWEAVDTGQFVERPTFEHVGVLTEMVKVIETDVCAIGKSLDRLRQFEVQLIAMHNEQALGHAS